jgi:hypothetical protein
MVELEQMREKYRLQDRITLLGSIKPHDVQSVCHSSLPRRGEGADGRS